MENDEKKYEKVINTLKNLKEVKAPENFEADLRRRINSEKFSKKERKGFWQNIFVPARLIPSLGLIAAAAVIFFVMDANSEKMDNPFLIEPRVREDLIAVTDYEQLKEEHQKALKKSESLKREKNIPEPKPEQDESKSFRDEKTSGRKEQNRLDNLSTEQDMAKDKGKSEGNIALPESAFAGISDSIQTNVSAEESSDIIADERVTKDELNFRQIQLSPKEQKVVNELKTQVQSLGKNNKTQK
ncbi:MAG: hypothetical protein P8X47_09680 [Ignavibacteriaceae bacterium]|jgi:hypothetical protein